MSEMFISNELKEFFKKLKEHQHAFLFQQPIEEVVTQMPDYMNVVKRPIDLIKIEYKVENSEYDNIEEFINDMELLFANCKAYVIFFM